MSATWQISPSRPVSQFMDVLKNLNSTPKLWRLTTGITTAISGHLRAASRGRRPSDPCTDIRLMLGLFQSQTLQFMVMFGRTSFMTGSFTRCSRRSVPQPELRGEDRDSRLLGGHHLPGEDGRPQGPGERERGDAPILPTQLPLLPFILSNALRSAICVIVPSVKYTHSSQQHALAYSYCIAELKFISVSAFASTVSGLDDGVKSFLWLLQHEHLNIINCQLMNTVIFL